MTATFTSRLDEFQRRHAQATDLGLEEAAGVVVDEVKQRLVEGYTPAEMETGRTRASVRHGEPVTEDGVRVIRVGTTILRALFWELGHQNLFSRKHERVEVWRTAMADKRLVCARAFALRYKYEMGEAGL